MKATEDILKELEEVAPRLPTRLATPYRVPVGYFDALAEFILLRIKTEGFSAEEEIRAISPLLGNLKKEMPYSVPAGYFESKVHLPVEKQQKRPARVIRLGNNNIFKYAAAAATIFFISLVALFFMNRPGSTPNNETLASQTDSSVEYQVKERMNKISDNEISDFVEGSSLAYYLDNTTANGELADADIQLMLSDITDQELEQYVNMINPEKEKFN